MVPHVPTRSRLTTRLWQAAVSAAKRVVSEVGTRLGLSWPAVQAAFAAPAVTLPERAPVEVLGIDETRRGRAKYQVNPLTQEERGG